MFSDYKRWKNQIANPPTGGGKPPQDKPFYPIFDELNAEDCRINGIAQETEHDSEFGKYYTINRAKQSQIIKALTRI
jgi:hypothetical protein